MKTPWRPLYLAAFLLLISACLIIAWLSVIGSGEGQIFSQIVRTPGP